MQGLPESDDPLVTRLFGALLPLMKTGQHAAMQIAAEHDLTFSHVRILFTLEWAPEPLSVGDLADAIGLSVAATGRAVDALHRSGIVSRTEDAGDRRIKRIALSERGVDLVRRIAKARLDAAEQFVGHLDPAEREQLDQAVSILDALTKRHLFPTDPTQDRSEPAA